MINLLDFYCVFLLIVGIITRPAGGCQNKAKLVKICSDSTHLLNI